MPVALVVLIVAVRLLRLIGRVVSVAIDPSVPTLRLIVHLPADVPVPSLIEPAATGRAVLVLVVLEEPDARGEGEEERADGDETEALGLGELRTGEGGGGCARG